ncbi:acyl carrier protein [Pseudomonadota bacterium]
MKNIESRLYEVISGVLNIDKTQLSMDSGVENIDDWDSLNHMNVIFALEEEFGFEFDDSELMNSISIASLIGIIETK